MSDGLQPPRRHLAAAAVAIAVATCVLDAVMLNVALPVLSETEGWAPDRVVWVVNAYQLTILALLLPMASAGEVLSYRAIYLSGLVIYAAGAVLCALAPRLDMLIAARMLQGVGAAAVMSLNAAQIRHIYPVRLMARGMGVNALVVALAGAAGPSLAALVLAVGDWRWIFAMNAPIALLALAMGYINLPKVERSGRSFDGWAALLNLAVMALVFAGADRAARGDMSGLALVAAGLGLGAVLVRRALKQTTPLIPLDLLKRPEIALSVTAAALAFVSQMIAVITWPFLLYQEMGRTVLQTGMLMTAWAVSIGCAAAVAGRLAGRGGTAILSGAGMGLFGVGLAAWSLMPATAGNLWIVLALCLCGLGFGLFQTPNNHAMLMAAPLHRAGASGGLLAMSRLMGQTTGATLMGLFFFTWGERAPRLALIVGIGCALLAGIAAVSVRRAGQRESVIAS